MRQLRYTTTQLPLHGMGPESSPVTAPLAQVLFGTTISFMHVVPPLNVLNGDLDNGGIKDTDNLWYRWKPFVIDEQEYEELIAEVRKHPEWDIDVDDTFSGPAPDWSHWALVRALNRPIKRKRDAK